MFEMFVRLSHPLIYISYIISIWYMIYDIWNTTCHEIPKCLSVCPTPRYVRLSHHRNVRLSHHTVCPSVPPSVCPSVPPLVCPSAPPPCVSLSHPQCVRLSHPQCVRSLGVGDMSVCPTPVVSVCSIYRYDRLSHPLICLSPPPICPFDFSNFFKFKCYMQSLIFVN